jgi:hypothetical protein
VGPEITLESIAARWRVMDAESAAHVLRNTVWSDLSSEPRASAPVEPTSAWEGARPDQLATEERAARVAWTVLTHDPRFARQLGRLLRPPFSEDFQEFIYLLVCAAARIGGAYAKHLDDHPAISLGLAAAGAAATLEIDLLRDGVADSLPTCAAVGRRGARAKEPRGAQTNEHGPGRGPGPCFRCGRRPVTRRRRIEICVSIVVRSGDRPSRATCRL